MTASDFVNRYGGIYEHSPWVAERVSELLGDAVATVEKDIERMASLMADSVDNAAVERQLELIRAHPDLAGKAQLTGRLTAESTTEQSSAGLDQCSAQEYETLQTLNTKYKDKFGFPFVMAVRESDRVEIIAAFASRLDNSYEVEFETALQEIHKIAWLRLKAMEKSP